jgi:hypothetical protein
MWHTTTAPPPLSPPSPGRQLSPPRRVQSHPGYGSSSRRARFAGGAAYGTIPSPGSSLSPVVRARSPHEAIYTRPHEALPAGPTAYVVGPQGARRSAPLGGDAVAAWGNPGRGWGLHELAASLRAHFEAGERCVCPPAAATQAIVACDVRHEDQLPEAYAWLLGNLGQPAAAGGGAGAKGDTHAPAAEEGWLMTTLRRIFEPASDKEVRNYELWTEEQLEPRIRWPAYPSDPGSTTPLERAQQRMRQCRELADEEAAAAATGGVGASDDGGGGADAGEPPPPVQLPFGWTWERAAGEGGGERWVASPRRSHSHPGATVPAKRPGPGWRAAEQLLLEPASSDSSSGWDTADGERDTDATLGSPEGKRRRHGQPRQRHSRGVHSPSFPSARPGSNGWAHVKPSRRARRRRRLLAKVLTGWARVTEERGEGASPPPRDSRAQREQAMAEAGAQLRRTLRARREEGAGQRSAPALQRQEQEEDRLWLLFRFVGRWRRLTHERTRRLAPARDPVDKREHRASGSDSYQSSDSGVESLRDGGGGGGGDSHVRNMASIFQGGAPGDNGGHDGRRPRSPSGSRPGGRSRSRSRSGSRSANHRSPPPPREAWEAEEEEEEERRSRRKSRREPVSAPSRSRSGSRPAPYRRRPRGDEGRVADGAAAAGRVRSRSRAGRGVRERKHESEGEGDRAAAHSWGRGRVSVRAEEWRGGGGGGGGVRRGGDRPHSSPLPSPSRARSARRAEGEGRRRAAATSAAARSAPHRHRAESPRPRAAPTSSPPPRRRRSRGGREKGRRVGGASSSSRPSSGRPHRSGERTRHRATEAVVDEVERELQRTSALLTQMDDQRHGRGGSSSLSARRLEELGKPGSSFVGSPEELKKVRADREDAEAARWRGRVRADAVSPPKPEPEPVPPAEVRAEALYDYEAQQVDELSFRARDVLVVDSQTEPGHGWWTASAHGVSGMIPAEFVTVLEEPVAVVAPAADSAGDGDGRERDHGRGRRTDRRGSNGGHRGDTLRSGRDRDRDRDRHRNSDSDRGSLSPRDSNGRRERKRNYGPTAIPSVKAEKAKHEEMAEIERERKAAEWESSRHHVATDVHHRPNATGRDGKSADEPQDDEPDEHQGHTESRTAVERWALEQIDVDAPCSHAHAMRTQLQLHGLVGERAHDEARMSVFEGMGVPFSLAGLQSVCARGGLGDVRGANGRVHRDAVAEAEADERVALKRHTEACALQVQDILDRATERGQVISAAGRRELQKLPDLDALRATAADARPFAARKQSREDTRILKLICASSSVRDAQSPSLEMAVLPHPPCRHCYWLSHPGRRTSDDSYLADSSSHGRKSLDSRAVSPEQRQAALEKRLAGAAARRRDADLQKTSRRLPARQQREARRARGLETLDAKRLDHRYSGEQTLSPPLRGGPSLDRARSPGSERGDRSPLRAGEAHAVEAWCRWGISLAGLQHITNTFTLGLMDQVSTAEVLRTVILPHTDIVGGRRASSGHATDIGDDRNTVRGTCSMCELMRAIGVDSDRWVGSPTCYLVHAHDGSWSQLLATAHAFAHHRKGADETEPTEYFWVDVLSLDMHEVDRAVVGAYLPPRFVDRVLPSFVRQLGHAAVALYWPREASASKAASGHAGSPGLLMQERSWCAWELAALCWGKMLSSTDAAAIGGKAVLEFCMDTDEQAQLLEAMVTAPQRTVSRWLDGPFLGAERSDERRTSFLCRHDADGRSIVEAAAASQGGAVAAEAAVRGVLRGWLRERADEVADRALESASELFRAAAQPSDASADGGVEIGSEMELVGLTSEPELNGKRVFVVAATEQGRYEVKLNNGRSLKVKPGNLVTTVDADRFAQQQAAVTRAVGAAEALASLGGSREQVRCTMFGGAGLLALSLL